MADSQRRTSGDFAKKVQRQLSRGKEKVTRLQNPLFCYHSHAVTVTFSPPSSSAGSTEAGKD